MNKFKVWVGPILLLLLSGYVTNHNKTSLVPNKPSAAADYFCTWNVQGYVNSFASTLGQRNAMTEQNLFGKGRYENWTGMFRKLHATFYFVLDDAWDVCFHEVSGASWTFLQ